MAKQVIQNNVISLEVYTLERRNFGHIYYLGKHIVKYTKHEMD